ncbi:thioesterase family protein [Staphylococcus saccharolyticus]|uniref:Putative thioesterase n=1 Tax=Staphylococcus saccharolyticus TaxID=33028 RepID=A0A380GWN0_9STAP|nr:thioesterase family protein [Staphylococcus saccharolyticus]MBL7564550.1 thioesterase family protein [Staphylococcus saccharolyticus]MBL7571186.1 thioesterase family protein [Staphylococcus saccharolyticus]QQB99026.1 thioesterase family protein [Staphylococcus saccharolyticus]QRJ66761.1 thioesterase family protein [Staphylococcus saccharolyticus]RTX98957.1 thioesterase [Staphylococcus saccharolyticus]
MINPYYIFQTTVHHDWVDYNGHLNDAMYNRIFSDATDDWLEYLGLTIDTIKTYQYTVFTLENHVMFLKEMKENEEVKIRVYLYDYDSKRLHVLMEMYNANEDMCSTYEVMLMGTNTDQGRPQAFPDALMKRIEYYYNNKKATTS